MQRLRTDLEFFVLGLAILKLFFEAKSPELSSSSYGGDWCPCQLSAQSAQNGDCWGDRVFVFF